MPFGGCIAFDLDQAWPRLGDRSAEIRNDD
jgi:hypothetical protein